MMRPSESGGSGGTKPTSAKRYSAAFTRQGQAASANATSSAANRARLRPLRVARLPPELDDRVDCAMNRSAAGP